MLRFEPLAYRPAAPPPALGRYGNKFLSQPFESYLGLSTTAGDVIRLVFHGATAALGMRAFLSDRGFFKWFGLVLGVGQGVGFVLDVVSLVERAVGTHPPESR